MSIFSRMGDWLKNAMGQTPSEEEVEPTLEEEVIREEDVRFETVGDTDEAIENIIGETQPEQEEEEVIEKDITKKERADELISSITREDAKEALDATLKEGVKVTREYINMEDLRDGKFDIYRNILLKGIQDDELASTIFRSGLGFWRTVAYMRIIGTITNKKNDDVKRIDEILEIAGLTPDKVLDNGIYDFIGYNGTVLNFNRELKGRFNQIGVGYLGKEGDYSSSSILKIEQITMKFDFKN